MKCLFTAGMLLWVVIATAAATAQVLVDPEFGSNMVLQRGLENRVTGTCAPGDKIYVSFGGKRARAAEQREPGRWIAEIDIASQPNPKPASIEIFLQQAKERVLVQRLTNIVVGDVWIVVPSGRHGLLNHPVGGLSDTPNIRARPQGQRQWHPIDSPQNPRIYGATYHFSRRISALLPGVPVGIVELSQEEFATVSAISRSSAAPEQALVDKIAGDAQRDTNADIRYWNKRVEQERIDLKHRGEISQSPLAGQYSQFEFVHPKEFSGSNRLVNCVGAIVCR